MQPTVENSFSRLSRTVLVMPAAVVLTLLLFLVLARLTSTSETELAGAQDLPAFDFILQAQPSELNVRQRERPPIPKETVQLQPMPEFPPVATEPLPLSAAKPGTSAPKFNLSINLDLSPALGDLHDSQITPDIPRAITFDSHPTVLKRIAPRYPSRALRKKTEGYVLVEFLVSKSGDVKSDSWKVIESVPEGVFDQAVLRSIKRWRFKSKRVDGKAVAYRVRQRLEFRLD